MPSNVLGFVEPKPLIEKHLRPNLTTHSFLVLFYNYKSEHLIIITSLMTFLNIELKSLHLNTK